jgi:alkanesulfonate monooxygenase SsuD/methylene tetrahydromethanopterin reductase-like flavin-dependent oxidoreductase (luciferase family)
MKVIVFDLLPYGENLDHLKNGETELEWPLAKRHFDPEVAMRTYEEHLEAWELMDGLGYYGVGFNEHHTSPYGLMNSPNLMAAAAAQRTKNLKLLIYGNVLPVHEPLRLAEELAMLDNLSKGRIISGFVRGIPREYVVYGVPFPESRGRFNEAWEIISRAWTEETFSYEGEFWSYKNVAIWPRPVQQPHPPIWVPITGSKESIEWAGAHGFPITPGLVGAVGFRQDIVRYYAKCMAEAGHTITPEHLIVGANAYVADSREQALAEAGPYQLYFNKTLFSHGNVLETAQQRKDGYVSQQAHDYLRPENRAIVEAQGRSRLRESTMDTLAADQNLAWGNADEVTSKLIAEAEALGSNTLLLSMNRGAMPSDQFKAQLIRFAKEVLPTLTAHEVKEVTPIHT